MRAFWISTLLLLLRMHANGQSNKQEIKRLADSLILANTDHTFFQQVDLVNYERFEDCFSSFASFQKISSFSENIQDTLCHVLLYRLGHSHIGLTRRDGSFSSEPSIQISFTENGGIFYSNQNFDDYQLYLQAIKNPELIEESVALEIGFSNLPEDTHYANRACQLTYDVQDKRIYWLVARQKGHSVVTEYTALIDGKSGKYVRTVEKTIHRGFFRAIGDLFTGSY